MVDPTAPTYLTLFTGTADPTTFSSADAQTGQTVAAQTLFRSNAYGVGVYNAAGDTDAVLDATGYFV